jgi:Na+/melibiose symporter-like transporter
MLPSLGRTILRKILPSEPVPLEFRQTFFHLFIEMGWIGVLSGTTIAFLSVYAARLGADTRQIGFLSAAPALVNLLFAIPAAGWIQGRSLGTAAFWSSVLARIFYLPLAFLPFLFTNQVEIWVIIVIILVMNLPLTVLNVSFNAMVIEAVPAVWRSFVVGGRNALLSIIALFATLISGQILNNTPFPTGYQIVFAIGFFGAAMSSFHLFFLRKLVPVRTGEVQAPAAGPGLSWINSARQNLKLRKYLRILVLLFCFHISQWLVIPVIPLFSVNYLNLNDFQIGLAGGMFNLIVFVSSFYLSAVTGRIGNHRSTAFSVMGLGLYPLVLAVSREFPLYIVAHLLGGVSYGILAGALFNYLAENIPEESRAASVSWYILASNGSILVGSLLGPQIAGWIGFPLAMGLFGVMRILSGMAILRWG